MKTISHLELISRDVCPYSCRKGEMMTDTIVKVQFKIFTQKSGEKLNQNKRYIYAFDR